MAYDPTSENIAHLRRIVTGVADFRGRSQRSEVLIYLVAMMLISVIGLVAAELLAGSRRAQFIMQMALWLPAISLFVRRLHDQNRTGWLALIMPANLGVKIYERSLFDAGQLPIPSLGFPYNVAEGGLVILFWVLMFWPGTAGANRFGPDPRQEFRASVH